jgi:hypothetical protein
MKLKNKTKLGEQLNSVFNLDIDNEELIKNIFTDLKSLYTKTEYNNELDIWADNVMYNYLSKGISKSLVNMKNKPSNLKNKYNEFKNHINKIIDNEITSGTELGIKLKNIKDGTFSDIDKIDDVIQNVVNISKKDNNDYEKNIWIMFTTAAYKFNNLNTLYNNLNKTIEKPRGEYIREHMTNYKIDCEAECIDEEDTNCKAECIEENYGKYKRKCKTEAEGECKDELEVDKLKIITR